MTTITATPDQTTSGPKPLTEGKQSTGVLIALWGFVVLPFLAVLAAILWRIDYSRLRELKYVTYGLLISSILAVMAFGGVARGSRRVGCPPKGARG